MKSKFLSLVILLPILLIGATLIVPSMMDWNKYKPEIQKQVKEKTGFTLELNGDISLAVLPMPNIKIEDVVVKNKNQTLVKLDAVRVSVALFPLLSKKIKVNDIEVIRPDITVTIDKNGKGNWENDVLGTTEAVPVSDAEMSTKTEAIVTPVESRSLKKSALNDFSIDDLTITDGALNFKNAKTGDQHKIEAINIDASIKSLTGPFDGDFSFQYNGQDYDISGKVVSIDDMTKIPVELAVALDGGDAVASFNGQINSESQEAFGAFSFKGSDVSKYVGGQATGPFGASGKIEYANKSVAIDGLKANIAGLKFEGDITSAPEKITLDIRETTKSSGQGIIGSVLSGATAKASIIMKEKSVSIPSYELVIRGSSLKGKGTYRFAGGMSLSLTADSINADEWMKLAEKGGVKTGSSSKTSKKTSSKAKTSSKSLGFSIPVKAKIVANIGALTYEGKTYKNVKIDLATMQNAITIKNISLNADHGTNIALKGKIADTVKLTGLDIKVSIKTSDADALLSSLNISREAYTEKIGALEVDGAINGSLTNMGFSAKIRNKGLSLTASGNAKDPMGARTLSGLSLRIQHANFVHAVKIAQSDFSMDRAWQKPLDLKLALNQSGDTINITSIKGKLGLLPIESGSFAVNTGGTVPSLSGKLALGTVVLPKTKSSGGSAKSSTGGARGSKAKGSKWSHETIDTKWLSAFTADLDIKAKKLVQNKWVFNNPELDFSVKDGVLEISALKADMFNGTALVSGKAVAGQNGRGFSSVKLTADIQNVNAQSLYSAVKGKNSNMITGAIVKASENISTGGTSMASLVANLTGVATIKGERIIINGVDITNFVRAMNGDFKGINSLSDISGALYKGKTQFDTLDAKFDITKGIVNFNPVTLDGPRARFDVTGNLNLPKWTIDIKNRATVKTKGDPIP
ncbi:MAG: AsmA family protein, partial [Alphaproteobacteria bacterium]|nr:AsmA family protein [Alphaproteobacteria bacterium]